MTTSHADESRCLSGVLLLGILAIPLVFGWFVLRRGYAKSLRFTVLVYATVMTGVGLVGRLGS